MTPALIVTATFATLALAAAAFAVLPIMESAGLSRGRRLLLASATAAGMTAIGGGFYFYGGAPTLALRSVSRPSDMPSLVAALAARSRDKHFDAMGWALLGRGYLSLNDPRDAAAAFRRGAEMASGERRAAMLSAYGEALTVSALGNVTPDAEEAFRAAADANPKDYAARYYLGAAAAARGDRAGALKLWQQLLADAPRDATWRGQVVDHIAMLTAQSGTAPPDIGVMVAGLANRLKQHPDDAEGWQRLVRAYAVLGQSAKAQSALAAARVALKDDPRALSALDTEARELKL